MKTEQKNIHLSTLKIGLIGCGKMGKHHLQAINLQSNAVVTAVADPFVDRDDIGHLLSRDAEIFSSADNMLENAEVDVVHIVTPPSTHVEMATTALKFGKHIYVEKPFTLTKEDAESIYALAQLKNLYVCAGHQVLFEKPSRRALQELPEIGQLLDIESYFSFRTVRRNITPVDQLLDILPHPVCLLLGFLEKVTDEPAVAEMIQVSAKGEARAILRAGDIFANLNVTLRGRPVESYVRLTGTNGTLLADFVRGSVIKIPGPGASAISAIYNTYSRGVQNLWKPTVFFASMAFRKHKSYPGLAEIIKEFYANIETNSAFPISAQSTIATVALCETIGTKLRNDETKLEELSRKKLSDDEAQLPPLLPHHETVLVTGGTGLLGRKVAAELRQNGHEVRVLSRSIPPYWRRIAGVDYHSSDLSREIPVSTLTGVSMIVHCAAETAGGKKEHERNTVQATRNVLKSAGDNHISKFVHISSIAVIKTSREMGGTLDEGTPLDSGNHARGPYVWGKAEAEKDVIEFGREKDINVKVIRLGPLVDFSTYQPPGRLGKEAGPFYVAIGPKKSRLSLCNVDTAAKIIDFYASNYDEAPPILNLVEPDAPTREELVLLVKKERSDLKSVWLPLWFLKTASPILRLLQRILFPKRKPIDLAAVFASEPYDTRLANEIITKMRRQHSC